MKLVIEIDLDKATNVAIIAEAFADIATGLFAVCPPDVEGISLCDTQHGEYLRGRLLVEGGEQGAWYRVDPAPFEPIDFTVRAAAYDNVDDGAWKNTEKAH